MFDSFHRSTAHRRRYSGHGLAICKKIVDRHDGTIRATDNPGVGGRGEFFGGIGEERVEL
ncbi:hypothetical protein GCM10009558_108080 [Virgisporangium aurantiacum]|uniref:ATP-binding protein n=1 Tax=Virgisporangium aurantiacum TaxID=175570 RepID=UPI00194DC9E4|nr:ATP-binding protein [Virgisporangium aurantiacum]